MPHSALQRTGGPEAFSFVGSGCMCVERVGWKESATAGLEPGDDASQHVSFSSKTHHTPLAERVYCLQTVAPCRHTCCMPSCVASMQHTNMQQCLLELAVSSAQCTEQYLRYALEARALRAAAPAAASQATTALGAWGTCAQGQRLNNALFA